MPISLLNAILGNTGEIRIEMGIDSGKNEMRTGEGETQFTVTVPGFSCKGGTLVETLRQLLSYISPFMRESELEEIRAKEESHGEAFRKLYLQDFDESAPDISEAVLLFQDTPNFPLVMDRETR